MKLSSDVLWMRLRDLKGRLLQGEPRGGPQAFELHADIRTWNDNPRPYVWTKTADQILASIGNHCTRINDSGH
jgi:hypothetical protein